MYNQEIRHKYFDALSKLSWDEFVKDREASFHSMRNIFIHTLDAVGYWLNILQGEDVHSGMEYDDYKTIQDVRIYMERVEERMRIYLNSLTPERVMKRFIVTNDAGDTIQITAEDILVHVFEEEVHHRGELIALMWQMNVEPPLMGWKYL